MTINFEQDRVESVTQIDAAKTLSDKVLKLKDLEDEIANAEKARPNPEAINAIHDSDMVIIAPGNPLTSIGPMLQIKCIISCLERT